MVSQSLRLVSRCTVHPDRKSNLPDLKLSVSDLPMLSCHYIQKGCLFSLPPVPVTELLTELKRGLSQALSQFPPPGPSLGVCKWITCTGPPKGPPHSLRRPCPPLAGRLTTDSDGYVYITCNDAGVDFSHVSGTHLHVKDLVGDGDVAEEFKGFFAFDLKVSYEGHFSPIMAVQVTELADGVFIGCTVNHAVTDGTSFWNFFNSFAELSRGAKRISRSPNFSRDSFLISQSVLRLPEGGPKVTFNSDAPVRERIFRFSRDSIQKLKAIVNNTTSKFEDSANISELMGKFSNDTLRNPDACKLSPLTWLRNAVARESTQTVAEISSFQSLCALLWRGITRARKLPADKTTAFRMAVNCRHRMEPKLEAMYFGNAIQSIPTQAAAGEVLGKDLRWCAEQLNKNVVAHGGAKVRGYVEDWERDPRCFPLGNFDGAMITMGSSPRFPMYDNDFGWGRPVAVRSGRANKFDGKISAFPAREGNGGVDLEVVLAPETMAGLLSDPEFMQYVSGC